MARPVPRKQAAAPVPKGGFLRRALGSLRFRIAVLVLLVLIPAVGIATYTAAQEKQQATREANIDLLDTALEVRQGQEARVRETRILLAYASLHSAVRGEDPAACDAFLSQIQAENNQFTAISVSNVEGTLWCNTLRLDEPLNISSRPVFARVMESKDFAIGDYQVGGVTGRSVLAFGYPVFDDQGNLNGGIFATLDLEKVSTPDLLSGLPEGSSVTLFDRNGTIVIRYPDPELWVGRSGRAEIVQIATGSDAMQTSQGIGLDGVEKLRAIGPVTHEFGPADLFISVGIPTKVAFAHADSELRRDLAAIGVIGAIALAIALASSEALVLRPVRRLVYASRHVASGDFNARSGFKDEPGEMGELARSFDQMAASLGQQAAERDLAERQRVRLAEEQAARKAAEDARKRADFLAAAGKVLSSSLDYRQSLAGLAASAVPAVADGALVYLLNEDGSVSQDIVTHVDPVRERTLRDLFRKYPVEPTNPHSTFEVVRTRKSRLVSQVSDEFLAKLAQNEEHLEMMRSVGGVSYVTAPITAHDRSFGMLTLLTGPSGRIYGDEDLRLAEDLANRCALAIYSSKAYQAEQKGHQRASFLARAGRALSSSLDYRETLKKVVEMVVQEVADGAYIYLLTDDGSISQERLAHSNPQRAETLQQIFLKYPADSSSWNAAFEVMRTGRPRFDRDYAEEYWARIARSDEHFQLLKTLGIRDRIIAPINGHGQTFGVLAIFTDASGRRLEEEDTRLATDLANRCALAIYSSRAYESEQTARSQAEAAARRASFLARIGEVQISSTDHRKVLMAVVRICVQEIADICIARVLGPDGRLIPAAYAQIDDLPEYVQQELTTTFEPAPDNPRGNYHTFRTGESLLEAGPEAEMLRKPGGPDAERLREAIQFKSRMIVPIKAYGEILGVLSIVSGPSGRVYTEDDLGLAEELGRRCGLAVRGARAYESEQQARRRASFLAQAGLVLSSSLDHRSTLQQLVSRAVPEIADWIAVSLLSDDGQLTVAGAAHVDPAKSATITEMLNKYRPTPEEASGSYEVIRTRKPLLTEQVTDEALERVARNEEHLGMLRGLGYTSGMLVPMSAHGKTYGTLLFASGPSGRRFSEEDLKAAEDLAILCGLAIHSGRLYMDEHSSRELAEASARRRTAHYEASLIFLQEQSIEQAAPGLLRAIGRNFGWDGGVFWVLDDPTGLYRSLEMWRSTVHSPAGLVNEGTSPILNLESSAVAEAMRTGRPVWLEDRPAAAAEIFGPLAQPGARCAVLIPARSDSGVLGLIGVWSERPRTVDRNAVESMTTMGNQIGQFMDRVRAEALVRELSSPVLPVVDRILLVPVVGQISPERARHMNKRILQEIHARRARVVVMDFTGAAPIDDRVADLLMQTWSAARLLGARTILTGLSSSVSDRLVALNIDLARIETVGDLRSGIERAEELLHGLEVDSARR